MTSAEVAAEQQELARRLSSALGVLNRRIRPAGDGLSAGLVSMLATVAAHEGIRVSDLAKCERIATPSATRFVADLEARGLVSRKADPSDGRASLIRSTASGRRVITQAQDGRATRLVEILDKIPETSADQLRAVVEVLERLVEQAAAR